MPSEVMLDPLSLIIAGSTQPQLSASSIAAIVRELQDPKTVDAFWQSSLKNDGPIEIWEINGLRYLYNGNHRWHAALSAGVRIPASNVRIIQRPGSSIPTWPLSSLTMI